MAGESLSIIPAFVCLSLFQIIKSASAWIACHFAEIFLDSQQLVVFGDPVRTGHGTGLDLQGIGTDGNVGNGRIFGFTGTVGNDGGITGAFGHFDGSEGFGQGANLIDLDQDRIGNTLLDTFPQNPGIGDELGVSRAPFLR